MNMNPIPLFKALSDPTRLRCLSLLVKENELCVCQLTHSLSLPQPKVSHHLANLRKRGLVCDRKSGLWIYYRLNPQLPNWVVKMIKTTVDGTKNEEPFISDSNTLTALTRQTGRICND